MAVQYTAILAYAVGIILLYILGRVLLFPMKVILKLVYNSILGGMALLAINFVGSFFRFHIALNLLSALIAGILGIPGIILLVVLKLIFKT
mgnify:CR=1 FL=1